MHVARIVVCLCDVELLLSVCLSTHWLIRCFWHLVCRLLLCVVGSLLRSCQLIRRHLFRLLHLLLLSPL